MKIKCPICGAVYGEGTVRFCKICMYTIGADVYLTNLLNHPKKDDLKTYNDGLDEFRNLWRDRNQDKKKIDTGLVEMVEVEGGTFLMGSDKGEADEKPVHEVKIANFLIGKYSVTQELWENIMGSNPSMFKGNKRPVENVSWYDAVEFCNKLCEKEGLKKAYSGSGDNVACDFASAGFRLPREAEWEFAARGGNKSKGYRFSGSDNIDEVAWYWDKSDDSTHDSGTKQANELGIYDMTGNVWEWCWDWKWDYGSLDQTDPRQSKTGFVRVNRGGSWYNHMKSCRVRRRDENLPDCRLDILGFRVVRTKDI